MLYEFLVEKLGDMDAEDVLKVPGVYHHLAAHFQSEIEAKTHTQIEHCKRRVLEGKNYKPEDGSEVDFG